MDEPDSLTPPRKKLKVEHNIDGAMDDRVAPYIEKHLADTPSIAADEAALQLAKEVECGITEFIHSGVQAFTGVLKKR